MSEITADEGRLLLNDAQKNSLTVTLRLLEERILALKRLTRERRMAGMLFRFDNNLSDQAAEALEKNFEQLLETIGRIRDQFDLPQKTTTLVAVINAFSSHFWALLTDEKSDKLNRYGRVDPQLAAVLDPLIDRLIRQLQSIDGLQG